MPYGEGRTDDELKNAQRAYASTDDEITYEVTTSTGSKFTVVGINSAKVVAGTDGEYHRKVD